jgi:hypothetical protein
MAMLDTADIHQDPASTSFPLIEEPPPTRMGNKGDPFIASLTREEHASYCYLRQRHGAATARRLIQWRRENPDAAPPRGVRCARLVVADKIVGGDWLVGLTSGDRVRVVLDGTAHDLTIGEAAEIQAALARLAA